MDRRQAAKLLGMLPDVRAYPLKAVLAGEVPYAALISISGCHPNAVKAEIATDKPILRLAFDDVAAPDVIHQGAGCTPPTRGDMLRALEFGRLHTEGLLAVHCLHGRSRSTAVAVAILADRLGRGNETEAVRLLVEHSGEKVAPNPMLVRHADLILEREGAIERALLEACPKFAVWQKFWDGR